MQLSTGNIIAAALRVPDIKQCELDPLPTSLLKQIYTSGRPAVCFQVSLCYAAGSRSSRD